jgi:integrase
MAKTFDPSSITKPGVHATGERNLYLLIASNGNNARSWSFRWHAAGKTNVMGLGPLHTIDFKEAQRRAHKLRGFILDKKDPRAEWAKAQAAPVKVPTFAAVAADLVAAKSAGWKNPKHIKQWSATLATYAFPVIGNLPVDQVTSDHVQDILNPIWATKTETATRLRQRIEAVLAYAKSKEFRDGDNPAAWHGHLEHLLAAPGKLKTKKHRPALPWARLPAFMVALRQHKGQAAKMIELAILTACRSGEVRGAVWSEFDLDGAVWVIPAERMKAEVEHHVPLSAPALELLRSLPRHAGTDLLFPSRNRTPLSDMTLSQLVRGMNEGDGGPTWVDVKGRPIVVHGFRGTFRTWAAEATPIAREVAEHALAHQLPDEVERAYLHSTLFAKRVQLMNEWAAWATSTPEAA